MIYLFTGATIQSAKDFGITLEDIKDYYEKVKENALALVKGNDIDEFEKEQGIIL